MTTSTAPSYHLLLAGMEECALMLGVSLAAFKSLESSGAIGPMAMTLGSLRRKLFDVSELQDWVQKGRCCSRQRWQAMKREGSI